MSLWISVWVQCCYDNRKQERSEDKNGQVRRQEQSEDKNRGQKTRTMVRKQERSEDKNGQKTRTVRSEDKNSQKTRTVIRQERSGQKTRTVRRQERSGQKTRTVKRRERSDQTWCGLELEASAEREAVQRDKEVVRIHCCCRLETLHPSLVLSAFSCRQLDFIQAGTLSMTKSYGQQDWVCHSVSSIRIFVYHQRYQDTVDCFQSVRQLTHNRLVKHSTCSLMTCTDWEWAIYHET